MRRLLEVRPLDLLGAHTEAYRAGPAWRRSAAEEAATRCRLIGTTSITSVREHCVLACVRVRVRAKTCAHCIARGSECDLGGRRV